MQRVAQGREPTLPTFTERDRQLQAIGYLSRGAIALSLNPTQLHMLAVWRMKLRTGQQLSAGELRNLTDLATIKGVTL